MLLAALLLAATIDAKFSTTPGVVIDGKVTQEEWAAATRVPLTNGGHALLQHDRRSLYIAILAPRTGIASLCTPDGKDVRVIHASAALGTAVFHDGRVTRDFAWTNRDTADAEARDAFLKKEHWFASASPRGSVERELQITLDGRKEIPLTIAFMSFAPDEEQRMHVWPAALADGCASMELASGETKATFAFVTATWGVVKIR